MNKDELKEAMRKLSQLRVVLYSIDSEIIEDQLEQIDDLIDDANDLLLEEGADE